MIEVMCASIAGVVVLGALASVFLVGMASHGVDSLVAESTLYQGRVEERLRMLQLVATDDSGPLPVVGPGAGNPPYPLFDRRFTVVTAPAIAPGADPAMPPFTTVTAPRWVAICCNVNIGHHDLDLGGAGGTQQPRIADANACLNRNRATALFAWWRDPDALESNIYYVQMPQTALNALTGVWSFRSMTQGQLDLFLSNFANRQGMSLLAQHVVNFQVTLDSALVAAGASETGSDIAWRVDYRARDF